MAGEEKGVPETLASAVESLASIGGRLTVTWELIGLRGSYGNPSEPSVEQLPNQDAGKKSVPRKSKADVLAHGTGGASTGPAKTSDPKPTTKEDVQRAFRDLVELMGTEPGKVKAKAILKTFGVEKVRDLAPENYGAAVEACNRKDEQVKEDANPWD